MINVSSAVTGKLGNRLKQKQEGTHTTDYNDGCSPIDRIGDKTSTVQLLLVLSVADMIPNGV